MEAIIPFTCWNKEFYGGDSFLFYFPEKKLYVFDNHRLSLWCWLNKTINLESEKPNLLYIDRHIDFRCTDFDKRYKIFQENRDSIYDLNIFREMLYETHSFGNLSNIDCGNFLAFASKINIFNRIFIFTEVSDYDDYLRRETVNCANTPFDISNISVFNNNITSNLNAVFSYNENICLDIDLDFFVTEVERVINYELLVNCVSIIKDNLSKVNIITIALSQTYCGGEDKAIEILGYFTDAFDVKFKFDIFNQS